MIGTLLPHKKGIQTCLLPMGTTFRWVRFDNTYKAQGWTSLPPIIPRWKELLRRRHTLSAQLNWSHNNLTTGSFTYLQQQKISAWPKPRHIEMCAVYINTIHLATSFWPQHLRQFFVALAVFAERTELGGIFSVHLDCEKDNNNKRQRDKNTTLQGKQSYIIL